jgi:hypothetical protein
MPKRTLEQSWATSRNWAKFRLSSMYIYEGDMIFTRSELELIKQMNVIRRQLIKQWEDNNAESKQHYIDYKKRILEKRKSLIQGNNQ